MPTLYAYTKVTDAITTHTLRLPQPEKQGEQAAQELATLPDGRTVVCVFDGHDLPADQPAEITGSIETLPSPLPAELKAVIREASPHVRLINQRMQDRIRERYSAEDEMKFSRIGTGHALKIYQASEAELAAIGAYGLYVQECREQSSAQRAALGL